MPLLQIKELRSFISNYLYTNSSNINNLILKNYYEFTIDNNNIFDDDNVEIELRCII